MRQVTLISVILILGIFNGTIISGQENHCDLYLKAIDSLNEQMNSSFNDNYKKSKKPNSSKKPLLVYCYVVNKTTNIELDGVHNWMSETLNEDLKPLFPKYSYLKDSAFDIQACLMLMKEPPAFQLISSELETEELKAIMPPTHRPFKVTFSDIIHDGNTAVLIATVRSFPGFGYADAVKVFLFKKEGQEWRLVKIGTVLG
jgi:hypothetical protein